MDKLKIFNFSKYTKIIFVTKLGTIINIYCGVIHRSKTFAIYIPLNQTSDLGEIDVIVDVTNLNTLVNEIMDNIDIERFRYLENIVFVKTPFVYQKCIEWSLYNLTIEAFVSMIEDIEEDEMIKELVAEF